MPVSFAQIEIGNSYSRHYLARIWGYAGFQALARGVVTPQGDNKIILFVTREKQSSSEQYANELIGHELRWEGPTDHFAERRIIAASVSADEIHLFYRDRHHSDFVYYGKLQLASRVIRADKSSSFVFQLT
ncbi:MAG: hypothetical protein JWP89_4154 [Schlesneria sp.]|nr:hypothetical protein [Schlesneria sp.]